MKTRKMRILPQYETRNMDDLVKEVILETLKEVHVEEMSLALTTDGIYSKLSRRANIEPYLKNQLIKREKFTVWSRRKEYIERMERINNIPLGKIPPVDNRIITTIANELSVDYTLLRKDFRETDYVDTRKILAYIFRKYMGYNLTKIGCLLGKHHSTIVSALMKHNELVEYDKGYRSKFHKSVRVVQEKLNDIIDVTNIEEHLKLENLNREV